MTVRVVLRPEAEADVAAAHAWYRKIRPELADAFLASIEASLTLIEERPEAFPVIYRDVRRGIVQRFPYGVFYILEAQAADVLAVFHLRRDPDSWQARR